MHKNTFQILVFTGFNFFLLSYALVQLLQHQNFWGALEKTHNWLSGVPQNLDNRFLLISVLIILSLFSVLFTLLARELYYEFGWTVFKKLGANLVVKRILLFFYDRNVPGSYNVFDSAQDGCFLLYDLLHAGCYSVHELLWVF